MDEKDLKQCRVLTVGFATQCNLSLMLFTTVCSILMESPCLVQVALRTSSKHPRGDSSEAFPLRTVAVKLLRDTAQLYPPLVFNAR